MKIHTSDKAIAYITLLSGLTISAVAIYYSVAGLMAIFSAAVIPIIVMGVALEISKLAATVWLKQNWQRAPNFIRGYLLGAIAILMVITSMGIFGFLSKAHSDQSLVSGDVLSKIAVYDEKIKTEKDNIEANRKALKQMDEGVDQVLGRSTDEKGADKAVALRKSQQKERARLQAEIQKSQQSIAQLNDARAPIAAEVRKVEAEVGPIKYIASFVYGETNETILEKAVTWVIVIIVVVFDPLAVILLLASQYSFMWFRKQEDKDEELLHNTVPLAVEQPIILPETESANDAEVPESDNPHPIGWMYPKHADIQEYRVEDADEEIPVLENEEMWSQRAIDEAPTFSEIAPLEEWPENDENVILDGAPHTEKEAMSAWKKDHPSDSLKRQRALFDAGLISELPWVSYIIDDAAEEAKKWAEENPETVEAQEAKEWAEEKILTAGLDERPGDYIPEGGVTYMENVAGQQVKKTIDGYTQNAEQGDGTLWQRIQDAKK